MTVSQNLTRNIAIFELINSIKSKSDREKILKVLSKSDSFNQALREVSFNIVNQSQQLDKFQKKKLRKFGRIIKRLSAAETPKKRKTIIQKGRGLPAALIPIAITLLNGLIS